MPPAAEERLLVVGTGLLGTSVALAARAAGYPVWLSDIDADRVALAASLGAGQVHGADSPAMDLAVVATPPAVVGPTCARLLRSEVRAVVSHVCSVQSQPQHEVEASGAELDRFVGSHPIAGSERSGPHNASAELFRERPWIVCPAPGSGAAAVEAVERLATNCAGIVSRMSADAHDRVLARLSHVPQLLASALAGSLVGLQRAEAALAGAGIHDTSRLADSDPRLWGEIAAANAPAILAALREVLGPLQQLTTAEDQAPEAMARAVEQLVRRGRAGRALLGGKHGSRPVRWAVVAVVVPDEPGELARLLNAAAAAGANVEDIRVDHSPGHPLGVVELAVRRDQAADLRRHLAESGWSATAVGPVEDGERGAAG